MEGGPNEEPRLACLVLVSPSSCGEITNYIELNAGLKGSRTTPWRVFFEHEQHSREGGSIFDGDSEPTTGGKRHRERANLTSLLSLVKGSLAPWDWPQPDLLPHIPLLADTAGVVVVSDADDRCPQCPASPL